MKLEQTVQCACHSVVLQFVIADVHSLNFQTMAIVNELGMEQLCAVMGSGASSVSLAACHLLQVMFEALTEGMKREIRGKDEAILPGEFRYLYWELGYTEG